MENQQYSFFTELSRDEVMKILSTKQELPTAFKIGEGRLSLKVIGDGLYVKTVGSGFELQYLSKVHSMGQHPLSSKGNRVS